VIESPLRGEKNGSGILFEVRIGIPRRWDKGAEHWGAFWHGELAFSCHVVH
jgi:hypothetical protein